jgi:hypothetical protein
MSAPQVQQTQTQAQAVAQTQPASQGPLPGQAVLLQAARLALQQDKPILLDYYNDTYTGKAFMGEDGETKDKMLVKSNDEFTSMIQKVYRVADDFIVMTENSIYIISARIQKKKIHSSSLYRDDDDE